MDIGLESMRTDQYIILNPYKPIHLPWTSSLPIPCTLVKKRKEGVSTLGVLIMEAMQKP